MAGTLAIDLGSSSTVVAFQEAGQPPRLLTIEPFALGEPPVVPSVIWLADAEVGQPLALKVVRGQKELQLSIRPAALPEKGSA